MKLSLPLDEFKKRRAHILKKLTKASPNAMAVIPGAQLQTRSRDTEFPFRQDSDFFYLTGFDEPNALLVLAPNADDPVQIYCQPTSPSEEVWHGRRLGVDNAADALGVDFAASIEDADDYLFALLDGAEQVFYPHDKPELAAQLSMIADELRAAPKKGHQAPTAWVDINPWLADMRIIKSAAELDLMRQAAAISVAAHKRAMRFAKPGKFEYQVAAEIHHEFAMHGALSAAYGTICGGGENACILHYTENKSELRDGDLLLIDAGAEFAGYAGDITRTFPVNGRFSAEQKALYNVVLAAQEAALATLKPGSDMAKAFEAAGDVLTTGLHELGILQGDARDLMENHAFRPFMIHGLGHWLGLDVHDVGTYTQAGKKRKFEPGMVLTIEPGIYIPTGTEGVDSKWHGIGIRIEDDVIITETGHENMTAKVPKTVEEIEQWMAG
ncbi:Xaa-Pro aminopeptidase [Pseudidiomarina donghaiensis]|uniref:Xaa-Pro aminopeptidase n=1 Tax=Pseudidiomarina donghaiensis TaxID=519452 RepID=A0A432XFJ1_9GAMM|nr:Xaa-Pro aminopeptidase [Pseudidiomarina donghaiensis]RUO47528.1 Xaa-Pro aminopeptidase [Pseudidiomarina donghaiensis]SFV23250.1 Xaa-Pro aminopeptidase [Pseudidiomarina donghaiensis]